MKPNKTRIFIDCEFVEDGKTIDLISIALVKASGESVLFVSNEFDESKASDWVRQHVLPKIHGCPRISRAEIRSAIVSFAGPNPEFWGYFADYDWVALCQLFGRMIDLPKHFPMSCMDLKQLLDTHGYKARELVRPDEGKTHCALYDARWELNVFKELIRRLQNQI